MTYGCNAIVLFWQVIIGVRDFEIRWEPHGVLEDGCNIMFFENVPWALVFGGKAG